MGENKKLSLDFNNLYKRAVGGDKDAQESLYLTLNDSIVHIFNYVIKKRKGADYGGDLFLAEDLAQEFWVYFYSKLIHSNKVDYTKNVRSYLLNAVFFFARTKLYNASIEKGKLSEYLSGESLIIYLLDSKVNQFEERDQEFLDACSTYYKTLSNDDKYVLNYAIGDITRSKVRELTGRSNDYITNHKKIILERLEQIHNEIHTTT